MGFGFSGIVEASFALKIRRKVRAFSVDVFLVTGGLTCLVTVITSRGKHWKAWPYFLCTLWGMYATWGYTLLEDVKTPKRRICKYCKKKLVNMMQLLHLLIFLNSSFSSRLIPSLILGIIPLLISNCLPPTSGWIRLKREDTSSSMKNMYAIVVLKKKWQRL